MTPQGQVQQTGLTLRGQLAGHHEENFLLLIVI